jgi:serine/threonine-protein kinase
MGEIYRATDTSLGRVVAVKVLDARYASDEGVRKRFTREALAVARLSGNPHIVTIYDVGEHDERPFIVMEYLEGGSLEERLREGRPLPPRQALQWLEQAAGAIDAAHRAGIVHRDLKPSNLLLDRHGCVNVADFGIASAAGLGSLTETGTVLGTASYLSPEQARGERTTPASDLYSLAIVAFELLTSRRPFAGGGMAAAHAAGAPPSVRDMEPWLPAALDPVFAQALADDPAERFGSAAELVAMLRAAFDAAAGTTRIVAPARRRSRAAWLVPLLALLLAAGAGGGVAGALLAGGDTTTVTAPPSVSVRTVTEHETTVVTTTAAPESAAALNNEAWALMQQGDYESALALLRRALDGLQGQDGLTAAYANYNMGVTLIDLGRCGEALPYLERSRELEPWRHEVHDALKAARRCS